MKGFNRVLRILCTSVFITSISTSFSQDKPSKEIMETAGTTSVNTEVFWLNLCKPSELTAIRRTPGRKRLEVNWQNALSFGLVNTNQFKYDYKINSIPFASFVDTSYASFANSIQSSVSLTPDPFFIFEVNSKSPNKMRFSELSFKLDSLNTVIDDRLIEMEKIHVKYGFTYENYPNNLPKAFKSNVKAKEEYSIIRAKYDKAWRDLDKVQPSLNELVSIINQQNGLRPIVKKLIKVESSLYEDNSSNLVAALQENIELLPSSIYSRERSSNSEALSRNNVKNQSQLLQVYQQSAQIIRTYFGRFEIKYDKLKNELLSNECKILTPERKDSIEKIIDNFLTAKEVFYDLQSLYTLNPLENKYLEAYLIAVDKYGEFLFKKFMALQKVINIDVIYITPTSSNMKNFDLITLELEKSNKLTSHTEKYSYDIYIKGGLKVDFSAGLFGTFLTNHQYNAIDSLDVNFEPTNKRMVKRVDNGKVNIGFGGMVNITRRTGASWFAPGVSFGLILSTQPSLQFTSGLTLSVGKTERLLFHCGYAFGFVKRVDGLVLNENIPSIRIGDAVRTIDKFLARPFFGLTYNLSKNNVFKVSSFTTSSGSSTSSASTQASP